MDCFSRLIATEVGLVLNGSQPCEAPAIQVADARLWTS